MVRRVYPDCRIDLCSRTDSHSNNIKDHLAKTTGCLAISKYRHGCAHNIPLIAKSPPRSISPRKNQLRNVSGRMTPSKR
jgi:hypothetical protein